MMTSTRCLLFAGVLALSPVVAPAAPGSASSPTAQKAAAGTLIPVTEKDAAWAKQARRDYPLTVCVTSDEPLGSMGKSPEYIYRVAGQPDRLVVFCCEGCEEDFLKEPAKYLAKIDAAKTARQGAKKSG